MPGYSKDNPRWGAAYTKILTARHLHRNALIFKFYTDDQKEMVHWMITNTYHLIDIGSIGSIQTHMRQYLEAMPDELKTDGFLELVQIELGVMEMVISTADELKEMDAIRFPSDITPTPQRSSIPDSSSSTTVSPSIVQTSPILSSLPVTIDSTQHVATAPTEPVNPVAKFDPFFAATMIPLEFERPEKIIVNIPAWNRPALPSLPPTVVAETKTALALDEGIVSSKPRISLPKPADTRQYLSPTNGDCRDNINNLFGRKASLPKPDPVAITSSSKPIFEFSEVGTSSLVALPGSGSVAPKTPFSLKNIPSIHLQPPSPPTPVTEENVVEDLISFD